VRGFRAELRKPSPSSPILLSSSAGSLRNEGDFHFGLDFWYRRQRFLTTSIRKTCKRTLATISPPTLHPTLTLPCTHRIIIQDPDLCVCGCQYGGCIPQRRYSSPKNDQIPDSERGALITFSVNGKCGFSVRSALEKRYAGLDGRDDHMFVGFRSAITIRFEVRGNHAVCSLRFCDFDVDGWNVYHAVEGLREVDPPGRLSGNPLTRLPPGKTNGDH